MLFLFINHIIRHRIHCNLHQNSSTEDTGGAKLGGTTGTLSSSKKGTAVVCFKSIALCNRFFEFAKDDPSWSNCTVTRLCPTS
ncbi:hypothetical protein H4Q26_018107 [Puccinia striiformis f. sp. tritici PST-130]|nr:hypothetical protein H4Q26_018107 [Puccinia striiformis f. sp. tritici PST-130]